MPKVARNEKRSKRVKRKFINTALLAILVILVFSFAGVYAYQQEIWVVKRVEVVGETEVLTAEVLGLQHRLQGENLLTLTENSALAEIADDPYVEDIFIEKAYPSTLIINIKEAEPQFHFYSLNQSILYDESGKTLSQLQLDEAYPLSEVERLIYINERPFRNDLLKDRWLADNLEEQQEKFNEKILEDNSEAGEGEEPLETELNPAQDPDYKEEFDEFVKENFRETPLNRLDNYYQILRSEVVATIHSRWDELRDDLPNNEEHLAIYSLIEPEEINDFEQLMREDKFNDVLSETDSLFVSNRLVVVSPRTFELESQNRDGEDLNILFSIKKDINQQILELRTIMRELESDGQRYKKIDLTGKKIVVA
jgi:hypothetical protein